MPYRRLRRPLRPSCGKEESVAGGAGADAYAPLNFSSEGSPGIWLRRRSEMIRASAGSPLSVHDDVERREEIDAGNDAGRISAPAQGLPAHVIHEFGAVDAFGETAAGEVFDFGGGGELSARLDPFGGVPKRDSPRRCRSQPYSPGRCR